MKRKKINYKKYQWLPFFGFFFIGVAVFLSFTWNMDYPANFIYWLPCIFFVALELLFEAEYPKGYKSIWDKFPKKMKDSFNIFIILFMLIVPPIFGVYVILFIDYLPAKLFFGGGLLICWFFFIGVCIYVLIKPEKVVKE